MSEPAFTQEPLPRPSLEVLLDEDLPSAEQTTRITPLHAVLEISGHVEVLQDHAHPIETATELVISPDARQERHDWLLLFCSELQTGRIEQASPEQIEVLVDRLSTTYLSLKIQKVSLDGKKQRTEMFSKLMTGRKAEEQAADLGLNTSRIVNALTRMADNLRKRVDSVEIDEILDEVLGRVSLPPGPSKTWDPQFRKADPTIPRVPGYQPKRAIGIRPPAKTKSPQKIQRELKDLQLVLKARGGSEESMAELLGRYESFARLKASAYFLAGGENEDLIQEARIGLHKAIRDFRPDKETSFRSFAELCITRQLITAIKAASRFKHSPLNNYVSFSHTPTGQEGDGDLTLGDALPGPSVNDPSVKVISAEELQALVGCLSTTLSPLEADALRFYLEGYSYRQMTVEMGCDEKTIDNALQRVKRKILAHQMGRQVLDDA